MDFTKILVIATLGVCSVYFIRQTIVIIKFFMRCAQEGVKAVKFRITVASVMVIIFTVGFIVATGFWFNKAEKAKVNVVFFEGIRGTELVDLLAEQQEKEQGIIILDPEQYYLQTLEKAKSTVESYTRLGITFVGLSLDGILTIIGVFYVITGKGCRNSIFKDAIPIFAEYDKQNGKIIIKAKDLTGKTDKLFTVAASPKNLASLGQFIDWEEQTKQEETL